MRNDGNQPDIDHDFSVRTAHPAPAQSPRTVGGDAVPGQQEATEPGAKPSPERPATDTPAR